ncbi:hypothetical protein, partial [Pseudomonas aeruginosa]|uniref:hypothetical protein n=1 Tax=Pseudomonas aeruginosa TaxID=287 RepID=UPI0011086A4D
MATFVIDTTAGGPDGIRAKQGRQRKGGDGQESACDGKPELRAERARKAGATTVPQSGIGETQVGGGDDRQARERAGKRDARRAAGNQAGRDPREGPK